MTVPFHCSLFWAKHLHPPPPFFFSQISWTSSSCLKAKNGHLVLITGKHLRSVVFKQQYAEDTWGVRSKCGSDLDFESEVLFETCIVKYAPEGILKQRLGDSFREILPCFTNKETEARHRQRTWPRMHNWLSAAKSPIRVSYSQTQLCSPRFRASTSPLGANSLKGPPHERGRLEWESERVSEWVPAWKACGSLFPSRGLSFPKL